MSVPVTTRLKRSILDAVQRRAARTRRSRSDTVAELIRLGLEVLRYPGLTFVEGPAGLRAHVAGTGLDVWEIAMVFRAHGRSEEAVLQHLPQLSRRQLRTALAYWADHKAEVGAILEEQERAPDEWSRETTVAGPAGH